MLALAHMVNTIAADGAIYEFGRGVFYAPIDACIGATIICALICFWVGAPSPHPAILFIINSQYQHGGAISLMPLGLMFAASLRPAVAHRLLPARRNQVLY